MTALSGAERIVSFKAPAGAGVRFALQKEQGQKSWRRSRPPRCHYVIVTFEKQEQKQEPRQSRFEQPHDGNGNDNSWKNDDSWKKQDALKDHLVALLEEQNHRICEHFDNSQRDDEGTSDQR